MLTYIHLIVNQEGNGSYILLVQKREEKHTTEFNFHEHSLYRNVMKTTRSICIVIPVDTTDRYYSIDFSFVTLFVPSCGKIFYNVTKSYLRNNMVILNLQHALYSAPRSALLPTLGESQNVGEFVMSPLQCAEIYERHHCNISFEIHHKLECKLEVNIKFYNCFLPPKDSINFSKNKWKLSSPIRENSKSRIAK